ncbi:MAG: hypothetical protein IT434_04460 [Phycisphaerales bacterium]|jgi:type II secretory pathway pseudopilin PulG|nr:hypothetical protein [Phycisphaerales bacterium]
MSPRIARFRRRASTLLECIVVVVVLALAVPPTLSWMAQASDERADQVNSIRAVTLAQGVIENIMADCMSTSAGLGFSALADSATYLDAPTTGLRARLAGVVSPYEALGYNYSVSIGASVDATGVVNADTTLNLFRIVTVTVSFPLADGTTAAMDIETVLADLS